MGIERNHSIDRLRQINLDDIYSSLGITSDLLKVALIPFFWFPADRFARLMNVFDDIVASQGMAEGALWLLRRFRQNWTWQDRTELPTKGPLLILSNHPGMTDTPGIFSFLTRKDLKILAADRPFLKALNSMHDRLIPVVESGGLSALKPAIEHLRAGGVLLTFPAGKIEPDPRLDRVGSLKSREEWFESPAFFRRMVPGIQTVRIEVSGVIDPRSQLTILEMIKDKESRGKIAAVVQMIKMLYSPQSCNLSPSIRILSQE